MPAHNFLVLHGIGFTFSAPNGTNFRIFSWKFERNPMTGSHLSPHSLFFTRKFVLWKVEITLPAYNFPFLEGNGSNFAPRPGNNFTICSWKFGRSPMWGSHFSEVHVFFHLRMSHLPITFLPLMEMISDLHQHVEIIFPNISESLVKIGHDQVTFLYIQFSWENGKINLLADFIRIMAHIWRHL